MLYVHMLLALGMLISGSLNTLTTNLGDKQSALGSMVSPTLWTKMNGEKGLTHSFDHPFFQALGMFVGEFMCMLAYAATRKVAERDPNIQVPGGRTKGALYFALPALLDITGTGTMYAGLCLSYASVFQMLRGSSVVFTCILSTVALKRVIHPHQWFAVVLIVIGICIVGWVSVSGDKSSGKDPFTVLVGDILIVLAQVATACQMCLEEKLMNKYPSPPLKVVGLEGFFGFIFLSIILIPMYYIRLGDCPGNGLDGCPLENVPDALTQLTNNPVIILAMIGNALSIAFFNFFGISVTQQLSAAHRMVLDSVRTLVVWDASLAIGWEEFHWLQLVGFFVLTMGTCIYNDIFRVPGFKYPDPATGAETPIGVSRGRLESEMSNQDPSRSFLGDIVKTESNAESTSFSRN